MSQQTLALIGAAIFAVPLLVLAAIAFLVVSRRLARDKHSCASRWSATGAAALAIHAVAPVCMRYVADFMMATAPSPKAYAGLLTLINAVSFFALLLAIAAFLVAMRADRVVQPNPSLERP